MGYPIGVPIDVPLKKCRTKQITIKEFSIKELREETIMNQWMKNCEF